MTEDKDTSISIRPVCIDDAGFLCDLMNCPPVLQSLNEVPTGLQDWADAIREWNSDEDEEDYIILENGTSIGWLGVNGFLNGDKTVYLKMAAMMPNRQRHGFGTCAIRELMTDLKRRGFERMILFTDQDNLTAQACYAKCGFRIAESLVETMSNGKDIQRYRMESCLSY
ncbi:MAG: GNAT family N-acetyltransferase [Clostridia bacterium]|nr:GNAT family N-acetyltransferase [Clostridia bacterium]